jgi:hypothetical protein
MSRVLISDENIVMEPVLIAEQTGKKNRPGEGRYKRMHQISEHQGDVADQGRLRVNGGLA